MATGKVCSAMASRFHRILSTALSTPPDCTGFWRALRPSAMKAPGYKNKSSAPCRFSNL